MGSLCRCYDSDLESDLLDWKDRFGSYPDLVVINSALWDINRWGPGGIEEFKMNIRSVGVEVGVYRRDVPKKEKKKGSI